MSLTFTPDGLTIQTFDEIYAELVAGYQAIYGTDINLDPDSPDGQRVGIEAKARLDAQAFALALYNQLPFAFTPSCATIWVKSLASSYSGLWRAKRLVRRGVTGRLHVDLGSSSGKKKEGTLALL